MTHESKGIKCFPVEIENREGFFDLAVLDSTDILISEPAKKEKEQLKPNIHYSKDMSTSSRHESIVYSSSYSSDDDDSNSSEIDIADNYTEIADRSEYEKYSAPTPTETIRPRTKKEAFLAYIQKKASARIIRRILKCTIAFFISTLFSTVHPIARALGQAPFIVSSGCLLSHPGRTVGSQLDATITSTLGAVSAIVYGLAGVAAATSYNAKHPDSHAGAIINCMFLVVGVFAAQTLRQKFPKLFFFSLQFMIVILFTMVYSVGLTEIPLTLSTQFGLPFLIGSFVSLFINLVLWPETAMDGLGRTLNNTLYDTKQMLDLITKQFFLNSTEGTLHYKELHTLAEKLRQDMLKVNNAYSEAKYEISYAYSSSLELNPIRQLLNIVTKHLIILSDSLKTEQMIFSQNTSDTHESTETNKTAKKDGVFVEHVRNKSDTNDDKQIHFISEDDISMKEELNIRFFAKDATDSYMKKGVYIRPHEGENTASTTDVQGEPKNVSFSDLDTGNYSERTARPSMSRKTSSHSSTDETTHKKEEPESQNTVHSFKSFLNLSNALPKPPQKLERTIGSQEKRLLIAYLERLRGPLLSLAVECGSVLECIRDSLNDQLDITNDDDRDIHHTSIWRYILHVLDITTIKTEEYQQYRNKKKRNLSFLCHCADIIKHRIDEFDRNEKDRMQALYKINLSHMRGEQLDLEIRDELFLVFFFIFTLREVASNLQKMAAEMRKLQEKTQIQLNKDNRQVRRKKWYMPQITTQTWRKWFYSNNYQNVQDRGGYSFDYLNSNLPLNDNQKNIEEEYQLSRIATNHRNQTSAEHNDKETFDITGTDSRVRRRRMNATMNDKQDNTSLLIELESGPMPPTDVEKTEVPFMLRFRYNLWLIIRYFQGYEFKFALKLSVAVGILTIPAWLPGFDYWFAAVRGPWAALTVISVMSPTSGGTLSAGLWRFLSTIIGAFAAWAVLEIDNQNGILISGFAVVLALPFFYIHFSTSYSKVSIITLVTYVVIALSQYVIQVYPEDVSTMVWQRALTLVIGLFTSLFLNWTVWPFVAREAIRKSLAGTVSDLGDYYSYVMGTFLYHDEGLFPTGDEFEEAQQIERKLEKMLETCHVLLELTDHEPRIKGPFPKEFYKEIIISANNLLDRMVSLRIILMNMSPSVKKTVRKLDKYLYRRDMVASILLHFYTLSASLSNKIPLPSFMPSARAARLRVLRHRRQQDRPAKLLRYKNLTWFAMGCATEEIIAELEHLTDLIRFIVGDSKFTIKARRLEKKSKLL